MPETGNGNTGGEKRQQARARERERVMRVRTLKSESSFERGYELTRISTLQLYKIKVELDLNG